jgi:hypothetical protein
MQASETFSTVSDDSITPSLVQRYSSGPALRQVERKNTRFALHSVSQDEESTVDAILATDRNSDIVLAPNHHFDAEGNFCGFRVAYPPHTSEKGLPVNRHMFFGHTVVEVPTAMGPLGCVTGSLWGSEESNDEGEESNDVPAPQLHVPRGVMDGTVLQLAKDPSRNRRLMAEFLEEIDNSSSGKEATFACIPEQVQMLNTTTHRVTSLSSRNATDSKDWEPELPDFIGIYHAFVRGGNKDTRDHCLYIVCSGGCPLAAELYYNTVLDLDGQSTVDEICDSEETWWLRAASQRARCRLIAKLATKFGIGVPVVYDSQAFMQNTVTTRPTVDTVVNDIQRLRSGHVALFNNCVDTTTSRNGLVNPMHPVEGVWIFRGPQRVSSGMHMFGHSWGDQRTDGVFPSGAFVVPDNSPGQAEQSKRERKRLSASRARADPHATLPKISVETNELVVTYRCDDARKTPSGSKRIPRTFSWYDEKALTLLSNELKWDRNAGVVELMPIIVGITKW